MFLGGKLNSFGFNSNTAASIAIIFAEATFSTATATASFEGGGYVYRADVSLTASATLLPPTIDYLALPTGEWDARAYFYAECTVNYRATVDWHAGGDSGLTAVARYQGSTWFGPVSEFIVDPGIQAADWHVTANNQVWYAEPWKVVFDSGDWLGPETSFVIDDDELLITRYTTVDWSIDALLWPDAVIDTGEGFLTYDGYSFLQGSCEFENIGFLTGRFVDGAIFQATVIWEPVATVVQFVYKDFFSAGAVNEFTPTRTTYTELALEFSSDLSSEPYALRAGEFDVTNQSTLTAPSLQNHAGSMDLNITDDVTFNEEGLNRNFAARIDFTNSTTLENEEPLIVRYVISNILGKATTLFNPLRTAYVISNIAADATVGANSLRTAYVGSSIVGSVNLTSNERLTEAVIQGNMSLTHVSEFENIFELTVATVWVESLDNVGEAVLVSDALRTAYVESDWGIVGDLAINPVRTAFVVANIAAGAEVAIDQKLMVTTITNAQIFNPVIELDISFEGVTADRWSIGEWDSTANLDPNGVRVVMPESDLEIEAVWTSSVLRTVYVESQLQAEVQLDTGYGILTVTKVTPFVLINELDISEEDVVATRWSISNLEAIGDIDPIGTRITFNNLDITTTSNLQPIPYQYTALAYGDWFGIAGTVSAEGVLRLVPAPERRTFYTVPSARVFYVN